MSDPSLSVNAPAVRVVACLCAAWCDTCGQYRAGFERLAAAHPGWRFDWIDIEDQSELVEGIDVENFPTLLVAARGEVLFAGVMLPHIGHLDRLLASLRDGDARGAGDAAYRRLAGALCRP
jgi:hypothetical protein